MHVSECVHVKEQKKNKCCNTYCGSIVMEVTGELDEPDITLRNRVFLKDVSRSLNRKKIMQWFEAAKRTMTSIPMTKNIQFLTSSVP